MFFLLDIENMAVLLFALVCAFFAITVGMHLAKKRDGAVVYIILAVLSLIFALSFAAIRGAESYMLTQVFAHVFFCVASLLPFTALFHAYAFYGKSPVFLDRPSVLAGLFLVTGAFAASALLGADILKDVTVQDGRIIFLFGSFAPLFFVYVVCFFLWTAAIFGHALAVHHSSFSLWRNTLSATLVCLLWLGAYAFFLFLPFAGIYVPLVFGFLPLFLVLAILFYISLYGVEFNIRTVIAETLIFGLWTLLLFRVFIAEGRDEQIINGLILAVALALGALVIHLFHRERKSRESMEEVAGYLAEVNTKLRQLDKQKSEFVSIASHQLRSPLSAVVGYSSLLIEESFGKIPSTLRMPIERIFESARIMAIEIDDFLNITRIEQGNMKYQFKSCDVAGIASRLVKDFSFTAKEKGLTLLFERPEEEVTAYADEVKLRQVLVNLIDNAIRYTIKGYVKVRVGYKDPNTVAIAVEDSGIGIPTIDQERLFGKFMRASNANMQSVHGTGLGLYLVREMILAHQGTIDIRSEEGEGTTCTITLPRRQVSERS